LRTFNPYLRDDDEVDEARRAANFDAVWNVVPEAPAS
jgi:hypothetical protein